MLFGNKRRAVGAGGGVGMPQPFAALSGDAARGDSAFRQPVNRLLNRAVLNQCPLEIKNLLTQSQLPPSFAGMNDCMIWVVDQGKCEVVWWRFLHTSASPSHNIGRVKIRKCDHLRAIIAYDVKKPQNDEAALRIDAAPVSFPFLLVASADGLEAMQLSTSDSPAFCKFKSWTELKIEPGQATECCVAAEDDHTNVILCNRQGELVVFRHDLTDALDANSLLDLEPSVFENKSAAARIVTHLGINGLSSTLRRFVGSEPSCTRPSTIMCTRAAPAVSSRRSAAAGRHLISVTVMSQDEVYVWRLAAADEAHTCEHIATRSRTALIGGGGGSSSPAPALVPQNWAGKAPSKLVGMCMQWSCAINGKWTDGCVQVLALHADSLYYVHYLSPGDLEPVRAPQRLPLLDDSMPAEAGTKELRLLPCTVTVDGKEYINIHVTDGRRVLSVRARGEDEHESVDTPAGAGELGEEDDWHVGPQGEEAARYRYVVAAAPWLVGRERYTQVLLLTGEGVEALSPTPLEARAQGIGDSERFLAAVRKATRPEDIEKYLVRLVQQAPEELAAQLQELAALLTELVQARGMGKFNSRAPDARVLLFVLMAEVAKALTRYMLMDEGAQHVLDAPIEPLQHAGTAGTIISEKQLLTAHLSQKERLMRQLRAKFLHLMPQEHGLHEAMDRLCDRLRACSALINHPSLVPGGTSVLAQAVQLTVNRMDWLGENALRPWAVAWRAMAESCRRVSDVLLGLRTHLHHLAVANVALPSLAAALADALVMSKLLFDTAMARPQVQQQAPERCGAEVAAQADDMGVEHLLCLSSWRALGELLAVVDETCMRCYAAARAAGNANDARVLVMKDALRGFQSLHLRLFTDGAAQHCFSAQHADVAVASFRECRARYLQRWRQQDDELACVPFRVELAAQLRDVETLVHISLHELHSQQARCEHNDRFSVELQAERYAVCLLRRITDTCRADDERGSLWYAPFSTYNYLADLDAMLQEREGESGATNLRWIAALRARDVSRNFKAPFNAQHALAQAALSLRTMGAAEVAPDVQAHQALNGMARLAVEAAKRRASGQGVAGRNRPTAALASEQERQLAGALLNGAVQLRENGVRAGGCGGGGGVWPLPNCALRCVEAGEELLLQQGQESVRLQSSRADVEAARRRLLVLLRDGMMLLGHWPHESSEKTPSPNWIMVFKRLMAVANEATRLDPHSGDNLQNLLAMEALASPSLDIAAVQARLGVPPRRPEVTAWPNNTQCLWLNQNFNR